MTSIISNYTYGESTEFDTSEVVIPVSIQNNIVVTLIDKELLLKTVDKCREEMDGCYTIFKFNVNGVCLDEFGFACFAGKMKGYPEFCKSFVDAVRNNADVISDNLGDESIPAGYNLLHAPLLMFIFTGTYCRDNRSILIELTMEYSRHIDWKHVGGIEYHIIANELEQDDVGKFDFSSYYYSIAQYSQSWHLSVVPEFIAVDVDFTQFFVDDILKYGSVKSALERGESFHREFRRYFNSDWEEVAPKVIKKFENPH